MKNGIEKVVSILLIVYISVALYNEFNHLLPWHEELSLSFDHNSTYVIVNWYDTEIELQQAVNDYTITGLSECEHRPDFNTSFCELWLVRPTTWSDEYNFDTIGHEFYHAVAGDWHE